MPQNKIIHTLVDLINKNGCRVTMPYMEASPVTVLFSGSFDSASYVQAYPSTLYIIGFDGQVAVSSISRVYEVGENEYAITYGEKDNPADLLVKILD